MRRCATAVRPTAARGGGGAPRPVPPCPRPGLRVQGVASIGTGWGTLLREVVHKLTPPSPVVRLPVEVEMGRIMDNGVRVNPLLKAVHGKE